MSLRCLDLSTEYAFSTDDPVVSVFTDLVKQLGIQHHQWHRAVLLFKRLPPDHQRVNHVTLQLACLAIIHLLFYWESHTLTHFFIRYCLSPRDQKRLQKASGELEERLKKVLDPLSLHSLKQLRRTYFDTLQRVGYLVALPGDAPHVSCFSPPPRRLSNRWTYMRMDPFCVAHKVLKRKKVLGKGSFGQVTEYTFDCPGEAHQEHEAHMFRVAVKKYEHSESQTDEVLSRFEEVHLNFLREVEALQRMQACEGVPRLYAVSHGTLVMETGWTNLHKLAHTRILAQRQGLSSEQVWYYDYNSTQVRFWLRQLAFTLQTAHRQGLYHRDVTMTNVVCRYPDTSLMLVDWGSGRCYVSNDVWRCKTTGRIQLLHDVTTASYQAPETFRKPGQDRVMYDPGKAEVWSLGCILGELCRITWTPGKPTGLPIFPVESGPYPDLDTFYPRFEKHMESKLLDVNLKYLLKRMLHRNPDQRISLDELCALPCIADATTPGHLTVYNPETGQKQWVGSSDHTR